MASIRKRGKSYQITVSNGRRADGRQIIETATFTPDPNKTEKQNQKALEKFVFEFEEKVTSGKYLDGEKLTYKAYIDLWLEEYARKQMQATSLERTEDALNKLILPELGHLKVSKIQPLHLQQFYDKLIKNGYTIRGIRREYKSNTIKRIHQIISSSLNTAVRWQIIDSNPCSRISPPKLENTVRKVKCFSLEEAQIFLDQLDKDYAVRRGGRTKAGSVDERHYIIHKVPLQMKVFFNLALFGGFRLGELVALTWDDVNFQNNTVSITKSTAKTKNGQITKCPKTPTSIRTISIPPDVIQLLSHYKAEQARYRLSLGSYWNGDNYIFIQDDGTQMDINTPNHTFKKIIQRYNDSVTEEGEKLPTISLHGLRHTSATLLIAQNIDVRTVSSRLGHAECSTTMNIYAHALKKQDEIAAESLGNLFSKKA